MKWDLRFVVAAILGASLQLCFAADTDVSKLAAANNTFAFKLLKQVNAEQPTKNIFISPYSAATALQMVANGAGGQTKTEMQQVLGTSGMSAAVLNAASKAAADLLNANDTNVILTTANALWYRQGAALKSSFIEANQKFFSSTVKALDFGNAHAAEAEINQWASDQTHGRIAGIADDMVDPLYTDLVLANAIYFKGKWQNTFDPKLTKKRPFHPATGAAKKLPMMEMLNWFSHKQASDYQVVRLPYLGGNLAMYVFLPEAGISVAKLLHMINGQNWQRMRTRGFVTEYGTSFGTILGHVVLPKFKLENTFDLNATLSTMGMKTAFDPDKADFSEMLNDHHCITKVRQKTFLEVGEEGTEAAAVTAISRGAYGAPEKPPKPFEMIVDRPFLFAIVDARSEMILFTGVVNDL